MVMMLDCISTNLTEVFREPVHFDFLSKKALIAGALTWINNFYSWTQFGFVHFHSWIVKGKYAKPVKAGGAAPDFQLRDDAGKIRMLTEFRGKKVVLYFYPKDNTPGCTKEACSLRDGYSILQEAGIVILGVSFDSPESHRKFKDKHNLPFILLSDGKKEVAKAYGASGGLLGSLMAKRYTYLIDELGKIVYIFKKVDVKNHAEEVLQAFSMYSKS